MLDSVIRIPVGFSKSAYLLILMLISVEFFHFTPIARFSNDIICLVLFLFWLLVGFFLYKPKDLYFTLIIKLYYWPLLFVWAGVVISFVAAKALYGQSYLTSLVSSRAMLAMLALPALGVVNPNKTDLEKACVWFSIFLLGFAVLDAIGVPILDRDSYMEGTNRKEFIDEDSFIACLPGFHWVAMALFFYLERLKNSFSSRDLIGAILFFVGIFLLQNRSMLFITALFVAYVFFSIRGNSPRLTIILRGSIILVILGLIGVTIPQWVKLFNETASNLGNADYNRILAYNYFLFQACPEPIYYLTGMGLISSNTSSIMKDLMDAGIYNSDVGFIGLWNHYGILPIIAVLIVVVQGLKKDSPLVVKFNALFIIGSSLTLACFNTLDKLLWYCLFVFLTYECVNAHDNKSVSNTLSL